MKPRIAIIAVLLLGFFAIGVAQQQAPEVYTATAIATQGTAGSASGRVVIRIASYTTDAERQNLLAAFKRAPSTDGLAVLRSMSKGYINIEGQPGRKIEAAFRQQSRLGQRVVLIAEHELSPLEKSRGANVEDFPLAVLRLQFDQTGQVLSGEIFPATQVHVTMDGFLDVQTESSTRVLLIDVVQQQ
jgi:hypothetical protein